MEQFKEYLGDGAYAHYDGYHVWLTTSDGCRTSNEVALDPLTLKTFLVWLDKLKSRLAALDKAGKEEG